jgi:uncharacterized protein YwqG
MKKIILLSFAFLMLGFVNYAQTTVYIPTKSKALAKLTVPNSNWAYNVDEDLFSVYPNDEGETARLITMIWASNDPTAENSLSDLTTEAFDVVSSLMEDIVWAEEPVSFENNGITISALDGVGYYVNADKSKDKMSTTIMLLQVDEINTLALVFFGTDAAYDKWNEELLDIILSITPLK